MYLDNSNDDYLDNENDQNSDAFSFDEYDDTISEEPFILEGPDDYDDRDEKIEDPPLIENPDDYTVEQPDVTIGDDVQDEPYIIEEQSLSESDMHDEFEESEDIEDDQLEEALEEEVVEEEIVEEEVVEEEAAEEEVAEEEVVEETLEEEVVEEEIVEEEVVEEEAAEEEVVEEEAAEEEVVEEEVVEEEVVEEEVVEEEVAEEFDEEIQGTVDRLDEIENLEQDNWDNLNAEERLNTLQEIEDYAAEIQGREPITLISNQDLGPGQFGGFDGENIHINASHLESDMEIDEFIDTVLHEGRHAYQQYAVDHPGVEPNQELVNEWAENLKPGNYLRPEDVGQESYQNQPIERDAWNFANQIREQYNNHKKGK